MKRAVIVLVCAAFAAAVSGCRRPDTGNTLNEPTIQEQIAEESETAGKEQPVSEDSKPSEKSGVLIAYFSVPEDVDISGVDAVAGASVVVHDEKKMGNTEYVAGLIQEAIGGDLFCIETVESYPLDHNPLVDQAADEQDENARPQLASHIENLDSYETILLGYPNWWGDMPMPLYSFLEEYDFGGKTIIPFITHGGSRASRTTDMIAKLEPEAQIYGDALVISREDVADSEKTVKDWAKSLAIEN